VQRKLADFGLAKRVLSPDADDLGLVGTPHYMAPELFDGAPASPASDVYAAGISYFFLLTGKLPFSASSLPEVVEKHRTQPIPDPRPVAPDVPDESWEIVEHCLAKRVEERYPDGENLRLPLGTLLGRLRRIEEVIRDGLRGIDVDWRGLGPNQFVVDVPLASGGSREVRVDRKDDLVHIWTSCGPVVESYLRRALELNAEIAHGALSIREHEGRPTFVMANVYPWPTCDPEEIRESVLTVARYADEVERSLTPSRGS
jgi:eukaryotic-like serine/threonine-protein kinase